MRFHSCPDVRMLKRRFASPALGRTMRYAILPPPATTPASNSEAHLICLLHGMGGNELSLERYHVTDRLHAAMLSGALRPAYVVAPDGQKGFFINWHDGSRRYEDYIVDDVLPRAEADLGLSVTRAQRHLAGVSMGGIGALQIALRHPDRFASVACLSAPILDEHQARHFLERSLLRWFAPLQRIFGTLADRAFFEAHNPYCIVSRRALAVDQTIFLAAGSRDRNFVRESSLRFHRFLQEHDVPHHWLQYEGGHAWRYWSDVLIAGLSHTVGGREIIRARREIDRTI